MPTSSALATIPCALIQFQGLWIFIKPSVSSSAPHSAPLHLEVYFSKEAIYSVDLSPCSPSLPAPKNVRMAQFYCTQQPNNLLSGAGFCPSAQEQIWWNRQNKIQKSLWLHILMGSIAPEGKKKSEGRLRLGTAFTTQGMLLDAEHNYLMGLSNCYVSWATQSSGTSNGKYRDMEYVFVLPMGAWVSSPVPLLDTESLSPRAGSCHPPAIICRLWCSIQQLLKLPI